MRSSCQIHTKNTKYNKKPQYYRITNHKRLLNLINEVRTDVFIVNTFQQKLETKVNMPSSQFPEHLSSPIWPNPET